MAEQQQATDRTAFVWNELMTTDISKATAFYTALFGWTTREMDMGPAGKYTLWVKDGKDQGGGMQMPNVPAHWLSYVAVPNVDESAKKTMELGGNIHVPPTDIPNVGRFAVIQDPTGAFLGLLTPKM